MFDPETWCAVGGYCTGSQSGSRAGSQTSPRQAPPPPCFTEPAEPSRLTDRGPAGRSACNAMPRYSSPCCAYSHHVDRGGIQSKHIKLRQDLLFFSLPDRSAKVSPLVFGFSRASVLQSRFFFPWLAPKSEAKFAPSRRMRHASRLWMSKLHDEAGDGCKHCKLISE
jgi:hypothetical protein